MLTCPDKLKYQFKGDFTRLKMSDKCCYKLKKEIALKYEAESKRTIVITGMRADEGGMRALGGCTIFEDGKLKKFHPLKVVDDEFENEIIKRENIQLCKLYYEPYNFTRTGCVACPFAKDIAYELKKLYKLLPNEYNKALVLWKPVYDEYIRIGYRLKEYPHEKGVQYTLDDYLKY